MPNPEISIVVPLYNKEREIGRCIRSVLAQDASPFELIVVNDGSMDGSADVVRSFDDPRIRLVEQVNSGVASARNRGIAEARTDLVAFLDADDQWLQEYLTTVLGLSKLCPEAGAYFTAFWIHRGGGWARTVTIPPKYLHRDKPLFKDYFATPSGNLIPSAFAIRKNIIEKTGPFQEMFAEDVDIWLRIAALYPIAYSKSPQAIWHVNASNRRCVAQDNQAQGYQAGALAASLGFILQAPDVTEASKLKAQNYVANRELLAVLPVFSCEGSEPARRLLQRWEDTHGKAPSSLRFALYFPRKFVQCIEFAQVQFRKVQIACAYLWYRRRAAEAISLS